MLKLSVVIASISVSFFVISLPSFLNLPTNNFTLKKAKELSLKDKCRNKYYLNNFNCCKIGNDIFIEDCGFSYKFIFETDIIGVKVKNEDLNYYAHENLPKLDDTVDSMAIAICTTRGALNPAQKCAV
jgi:hypothetical protein